MTVGQGKIRTTTVVESGLSSQPVSAIRMTNAVVPRAFTGWPTSIKRNFEAEPEKLENLPYVIHRMPRV